MKPTVTQSTSPTVTAPVHDGEAGAEDHVYANSSLATPALTSRPPGGAEREGREERSPSEESQHAAGADAGADADADAGADDDVYAVFKATKPELDRVQKYLVDRLASGELRDEIKVFFLTHYI